MKADALAAGRWQGGGPPRLGGAMLPILITCLLLSTVVATALLSLSKSVALSRGQVNRHQAVYAAESGVNRALWEVFNGDGEWTGWSVLPDSSRQLNGTILDEEGGSLASYVVTVSRPSPSQMTIEGTGTRTTGYGNDAIERQIVATLGSSGGGDSWLQWGLYGNTRITFAKDCLVDSYDSTAGWYYQTKGSKAIIAAAGNEDAVIQIGHNSSIKGDAYCHPDRDPNAAIVGSVHGSKKKLPQALPPPAVEAPTDIGHDVGNWQIGQYQQVFLNQDTVCDSLTMAKHSRLTVCGDVRLYLRGPASSQLDKEVWILITPGSSLTVYVGSSSLSFGKQVYIAGQGDNPRQCVILGLPTCETIEFKKEASVVCASIYAPSARVEMRKNCHLFGALVAEEIDLKKESRIHVDESLADDAPSAVPSYASGWALQSWRIVR